MLVSAFADVAGLSWSEGLLIGGEALVLAGEQAAPGGAFEYFLTDGGCLELVQFLRVVASVSDPSVEIALADARAQRPRAYLGGEVGLTAHVGLSRTGERAITGQSLTLLEERGAQVAALAECLVVTPADGSARPR